MRPSARLIALSTFLVPAFLSAQTVSATNGTAYNTAALSTFTTLGADLGGLAVTATFADGSTSSGSFGNIGGGQYGVSNAQFLLAIGATDDTFGGLFTLSNATRLSLTGLTMRGAPGNLVFDRNLPSPGSAGSESGWDFVFSGLGPAGSTAQYTNLVSVGATPAVGDLFESLIVAFGSGGLGGGTSLAFIADIDAAAVGAVVVPGGPRTVTPEPATLALLATGLVALGAAVRRKRFTA